MPVEGRGWRRASPRGHSRVVESYDTALATILGVLLLLLALGGVVWLDRGPIGRRGRALRSGKPAPEPRRRRGRIRRGNHPEHGP